MLGHPVRQYPVAISAGAMALAWARQEQAPEGATVVVEREISPLGRHGKLWTAPPESTLACAVVSRPKVAVSEGDVAWLVGGVVAAEAVESLGGPKLVTWWPDAVIEQDSGEPVASVKPEVQLGPGQVAVAVLTLRIDLARAGIDPDRREDLLEAVLRSFDTHSGAEADAAGAAAAYEGRCVLIGKRVKVSLLPQGQARGVARHVDRSARLALESATGMVERVGVDQFKSLEVV